MRRLKPLRPSMPEDKDILHPQLSGKGYVQMQYAKRTATKRCSLGWTHVGFEMNGSLSKGGQNGSPFGRQRVFWCSKEANDACCSVLSSDDVPDENPGRETSQ